MLYTPVLLRGPLATRGNDCSRRPSGITGLASRRTASRQGPRGWQVSYRLGAILGILPRPRHNTVSYEPLASLKVVISSRCFRAPSQVLHVMGGWPTNGVCRRVRKWRTRATKSSGAGSSSRRPAWIARGAAWRRRCSPTAWKPAVRRNGDPHYLFHDRPVMWRPHTSIDSPWCAVTTCMVASAW